MMSVLHSDEHAQNLELLQLLAKRDAAIHGDNGADIQAEFDEALISAATNGHFEAVQLLVKNGADIYAVDNQALISAARNGHLEIVKFLVQNGANIYAQDNYTYILIIVYQNVLKDFINN